MSRNELDPIAYSIAEAAKVVSTSRPTIYAWIKSGKIRATRVGGRNFVVASSLRALIEGEAA